MAAISSDGLSPQQRGLLESVRSAAEKCNRCGFCQAGCPTYKVTGIEWMTARGRIALVRAALEGQIPLDAADLQEPLWTCLGCDGCTMHCPPGIKTDEIVDAAREALALGTGEPLVQRLVLHDVLPRPELLAFATKAARLGQSLGVLPIGAKLGRLVLGGQLDQAADVLPRLPSRTARETLGTPPRVESPHLRAAYFLGCAGNLLFPEVAEATVRVLRRNRVDVVVPANVCCGKPAAGYGDADAALALVRRNVDLLGDLDVDAIVVDCPTCGTYLQRYPALLSSDPERAAKAEAIARKVRDVGALLEDLGPADGLGRFDARVTYHDPCHLAHFQGIAAQPRKLLRSIEGVDYSEAAEADLCCGGAGTFALRERQLSLKVLDRKMENFARTGADTLVTACPSCLLQLGYGARRKGLKLRVLHTVQVLDQAYANGSPAGA
jgi:glycolate oxidase iron-sulfur subunit